MTTVKTNSGVRQETIQKSLSYFNDLSKYLQENSGKITVFDNNRMAKKNHVSNYLLYQAVGLGYIQKIERGVYKKIKDIDSQDVKKIVETYNKTTNSRLHSKSNTSKSTTVKDKKTKKVYNQKVYKPKGFASLINQTDKYFVVNHRGLPLTRPMGIRRAKALAETYAKKNIENKFYIAEIKIGVSMKYVASTQTI